MKIKGRQKKKKKNYTVDMVRRLLAKIFVNAYRSTILLENYMAFLNCYSDILQEK